jgi:hypothetical protein
VHERVLVQGSIGALTRGDHFTFSLPFIRRQWPG